MAQTLHVAATNASICRRIRNTAGHARTSASIPSHVAEDSACIYSWTRGIVGNATIDARKEATVYLECVTMAPKAHVHCLS